jgi:iron complex outermembrane receptor protein
MGTHHAGPRRPLAARLAPVAHAALVGSIATLSAPLAAQSTPTPAPYDPIVVTATRDAQRAFDVPASVDVIDGAIIRGGQPAINLSESLVRVPGIFAANRQNYAQDLQISSRGFGARAQFGVRGVRLYQDDIPVTMPDGQGQTGSFSLCRGPHRGAARTVLHARTATRPVA